MRELLEKLNYPIPAHALRLGYTLGGLSAFAFLLMLVSGTLLAFHYIPAFSEAKIEPSSTLEAIRSFHAWAAEAFFVLILLHMTRIVLTKAAAGCRKVNWFVGLGLLLLVFGSFFTGTVLKWDQEGYEALAHQLVAFKVLPGGEVFQKFFEGKYLLARVFTLHAVVFPLLILCLMGLHFIIVKALGISPCVPGESYRTTHVFGQHLRKLSGWGIALAGGLLFLALSLPPPHYDAPYSGVEWTKPPWVFYWIYALENFFGIKALIWAPLFSFGGLAILPFLLKEKRQADLGTWLFLAGLLFFLGVCAYVAFTPPVEHL